MNIKLKGIEIDAFRAYKERQLFNFLNESGEIANLVVIFAPNGYGKTSFYDAVEWALTGKINRISNNGIMRNTADYEQGSILRNKKSDRSFGRVKIIAEKDFILEKKTKELGKYGRKTDYCEGEIIYKSSKFDDIDLSEFSSTSILGQDKIDSFLRFSNPRERFDTLSNFWDDSDGTSLFKSILVMYNESKRKMDEYKTKIKKIEQTIVELVIRPNIISEINKLIEEFNDLKIKNLTINNFSIENCSAFVSVVINLRADMLKRKDRNDKKLKATNYLLNNFSIYNTNTTDIINLNIELNNFINILSKFNKKKVNEERISVISTNIINLNARIEILRKLQSYHNKYFAISNEIKNKEVLNYEIVSEISNDNVKKIECTSSLKNVNNKIENTEKTINIIGRNINELDIQFNQYHYLVNKRKIFMKNIGKVERVISLRYQRIHCLRNKKNKYEEWLKYEPQFLINVKLDEPDKDILSYIKELRQKLSNLKTLEEDLVQKEKDYLNCGKLSKQLNEIAKFGKQFIEGTQTSTCPLCKKEYQNFNELIKNVNSGIKDVLNLEQISNDIKMIKNNIENVQNEIERSKMQFRSYISEGISILSDQIIKGEEKNTLNRFLMDRLGDKIKNNHIKIDEIKNFFTNLGADIELEKIIDLKEIKDVLISKIDDHKKILESYLIEKKFVEHNIKKIEEELDIKEKQIVLNTNKKRELSADPIVTASNKMLNELNIEYDIKYIIEEIRKVSEGIQQDTTNKNELIKENDSLSEELELYDADEILILQNYKELLMKEKKHFVNEYKEKFSRIFPSILKKIIKEDIETLHQEELNRSQSIKTGLYILEKIDGYNKYIENHIESQNKKSTKVDLEKQLEKIERANKELDIVKEMVKSYIEEKIANAFNLESINSIYQRIDPHPDFYDIKFEPDLTRDKPELNIYAYSEEDTLAPILYFSSAQLNILSLSIFLARAALKDKNGIDTIFMDDPIQHLDNLNVLSFIDLLRTLTVDLNKQIIVSTHNESFYNLIKRKMDSRHTNSKYIELESFGKIRV
ncbi:AAA family ATPase [Bacillus toyonensis]|uniref:AAA family ATPase n=2 Tax=Bacillus toyonensis TaxID=155322 RepID=UPI000CD9C773|nr:AAA family ATPase [Bacillus toyonensis]MED3541309.1 AAA family ATPase [Bacillus toyonensis]